MAWTQRQRRILWTGRVVLAGALVFGTAATTFLVWFWFDSVE